MEDEKKLVPLKDLVPREVFQAIFEKMMENEEKRCEEDRNGTGWKAGNHLPKSEE
jgi:hypothetical protein